jgi:16S rRNA (uracil1498-N3)-methyltransferase
VLLRRVDLIGEWMKARVHAQIGSSSGIGTENKRLSLIIHRVSPRFFAPDAQVSGDLVTLPDEEAEHLTRVLRLGTGAAVRVFNGSGDEFESVVEAATKDVVQVRIGRPRNPAPEAGLQVTLAQAVLKGDKMDDVVRDAVMIGATAIRPVLTARTETSASILEKSHRRDRWERVAVSAAKQCGRAVVPPMLEPVTFEVLIQILLDRWLAGPAIMLVEPGATKTAVPFSELDVETPRAATVVVGPEGGWTPEEIEAASVVCRLVTMGKRTLRADAMGLIAISAVFSRWKEF